MLACTYAVPNKFGRPVEDPAELEDYEPSDCEPLVPVVDSTPVGTGAGNSPDLLDDLWDLPAPGQDLGIRVVTHRVRGKSSETPDAEAERGLGESPAKSKHLTLFIGVPLRSKKGREVYPQVQGVINKLEAAGYPVHRYHSDRAKEQRSDALIRWLKERGIYLSSTAGESPAGNRAEIAVQQLKGAVRKLLVASRLDKQYWPLALLHASTRFWIRFNETLGIVQPHLLPFGMRLMARKRMRSGYDAQWESRTVEGTYVGHAPGTPGGHLVLVPSEGGHKVLLTNTVYPLRASAGIAPRPKYRLKGKSDPRSPHFVVRVLAASELPNMKISCCDARLVSKPGGESLSNSFSGSNSSELVNFEADFDVESFEPALEECFSSPFVEVLRANTPEGSGLFGLEPESSDDDAALLRGVKVGLPDDESRLWIRGRWEQGDFSDEVCLEVLNRGLGWLPGARRKMIRSHGRAVLLGLYGLGGFHGVSKASSLHEEVTRYLNGYVSALVPEHAWVALYVSRDTKVPVHRDLRNAPQFATVVKALGKFVGGGLWIEGDHGLGPVCKQLPDGTWRAGWVHDVRKEAVLFRGQKWHVSEHWEKGCRWVISAFTPRDFGKTLDKDWEVLRGLGFPVDRVRLEADGVFGAAKLGVGDSVLDSVDVDREVELSWEVGLPQPLLEDSHREAFVWWHESVSRLSRMLSGDLCEAIGGFEDVSGIMEQIREVELLSRWLEQGLEDWVEAGDCYGAMRVLKADVPLADSEPSSDMFLQTRTISLGEAREELGLWKEPALDEVTSLETTNHAVDRVKASVVDKWIDQGFNVIQLPGKAVLTRKSGTGKRRFRAVCCGNYLPPEKLGLSKDDVYASGAEALTLRVALTFASVFVDWTGIIIDIKSAFLYAPIGTRSKGSEERIIVRPPALLTELGILQADDRWHVRKALYGLPTSPRDWGDYRDKEFRTFVILCEGVSYGLFQSKSDESLWLVQPVGNQGRGNISGLLVVYVDDLAFFAPPNLCQCFIDHVQNKWKTSPPSWLGEDPVTFCGAEVTRTSRGYRLTQVSYLRELLQRYGIEGTAASPMTKWTEPLEQGPPDAGLVKEAQGITGALLWVSTRSRPDIAYAVSRMGQQATKVPDLSIAIGRQVLQYLNSTLHYGIEYLHESGPYFSGHGQLAVPRQNNILEVYSDASHSPCGGRSVQCFVIVWRGSPIAWESTRQSFTTLSSAEAELVGMTHAVQMAESVQPLVDEVIADDSLIALQADNSAAVRAFESAPSGWRNRHLRMRAQAGREKIEHNRLKVGHLSGEHQVADLGTKPLSRPRILYLLELINVRDQLASPEEVKAARILSRVSLTESVNGVVTARALAGLALLASLPRARGQPEGDVLVQSLAWLNWVLGVIVLVCCGVLGAWFLGFSSFGFSGHEEIGVGLTEVEDSPPEVEKEEEGVQESASGSSEEFNQVEWEQAQAKLIAEERRTGLTFVQRARLRGQLRAGGVVDVPIFQQRYGPLPSWLTGGSGNLSTEMLPTRSALEVFLLVLSLGGGRLVGFLGVPSAEWRCVRGCNRLLRTHVSVTLAARVRRRALETQGEHRGGSSSESDRGSPKPSRALSSGATGGSAAMPPPNESEYARPLGNEQPSEGRPSGCQGEESPSGTSGEPVPSPYTLLDIFEGSVSPVACLVFGYLGSYSPVCGYLRLVDVGFWRSIVLLVLSQFGDTGRLQVVVDQVLYYAAFEFSVNGDQQSWIPIAIFSEPVVPPSPEFGDTCSLPQSVQFGGSSSSAGVPSTSPPVPNVQVGGSSSSHGMPVSDGGAFTYEDLSGISEVAMFPLVGTWLKIHYFVHLMSMEGGRILWFLGERSVDWLSLREVSVIVRYGMAGAIVDVLRASSYALLFQSSQWFESVEDYVRFGLVNGCHVRLPSWEAVLQPTITGQPYPFEDSDGDDPSLGEPLHRGPASSFGVGPGSEGMLQESRRGLSSSSEAGSSTVEPSAISASLPTEVLVFEADNSAPEPAASSEPALLVNYVDDQGVILLPGGSEVQVQGIVQGLASGDWSLLDQNMPESVGAAECAGAEPESPGELSLPVPRGRPRGALFWRLVRFCILVVVVLWILSRGVRRVEAVGGSA